MDVADVKQARDQPSRGGIMGAVGPAGQAAARLAPRLGHPVYDCLYLALAGSHSASFATADERLRAGAERVGVRYLAES